MHFSTPKFLPLTSQEVIVLANYRSLQLRRQARQATEAQYQALLQAIQVEVESKNIVVEDFPRGD